MAPIEKKRKRAVAQEEEAFPRGGASVLTPLEHKQIQIEATRDVLFEQKTKATATAAEEVPEDGAAPKKRHKTKSKGSSKKVLEPTKPEEETVKIEGLSYKRLVPGSLVLGQVSQINDNDIALSLPNNLTGYVPITSISDQITRRIEALAGNEDEEEDVEDDEDSYVELTKIFTIGQYLRAYVVSTSSEEAGSAAGKSKRHIELSLRPQQSNDSISLQNVVVNNTIMASVKSAEDHGLVMDLGLEDQQIRGFIAAGEIGQGLELSEIQEGAVFLCSVNGLSSNGKIVQLCADPLKFANLKTPKYLTEAPTIDAFLPGTAVEMLVTDITSKGVIGKLMGMVDTTADLIHSSASTGKDLEKKYKVGSKVKCRIICTFPTSDPPKLGVSLLDHVISLSAQQVGKSTERENPLDTLPLSAIVEEVTVKKVESAIGLFVDVGVKGVPGFVHISRVKDGKIETLSETGGAYKVGSVHRGRIIGYNSIDGQYLVSLEPSVLEQPFLRVEDLTIGAVVKGKVEKIVVNAGGVGGLLINLATGITGLVPEAHMSDVKLLHPEKKFKEGMTVKARVLSTDPSKQQIRLTLKKSLVNTDAPPFLNYEDLNPGMESPGTIVNIVSGGAVVQFYGTVRGFLPVREMSEAYIQDPSEHFRLGQVVNVHVLNVDPEERRLTVSCKDPSVFGATQEKALKALKVGQIVSGVVTQKANDDISIDIQGSGLRAVLPVGHLTDGSTTKNLTSLKKIRVGQTLTDLVVILKLEQKRLIVLTNKPSLVKDTKKGALVKSFEDLKLFTVVHGFVKNITLTAAFIQFGSGLTGLLPKSRIGEKALELPNFGLEKYQSVEVKIVEIDHDQQHFVLTQDLTQQPRESQPATGSNGTDLVALNPVDLTVSKLEDLSVGKLTQAIVTSVKETQINVKLADNIQGRIDVSEAFDSWEAIVDPKQPLSSFKPGQVVNVRVLGIHDARNHRFLPISHRSSGTLVFELSAKPSQQIKDAQEPLELSQVKVGSSWIAFINNVQKDFIWVNLSTAVRGRIQIMDISDDISLLEDVEKNFPIGTAIRVRVANVDAASNRLDLTARSADSKSLTFKSLSKGMILPGKVTKSDERHIMVQLSEKISGPVNLTDLADDFSKADPSKYKKNDIVRVCILDIDAPNKKVRLSARPSRVLNSSLPVEDPEITSISELKKDQIVRGFIKNVSDKGIFVNLGSNVTAFVRVSDLSDKFVKDWKDQYEVDLLVKGKIISVDPLLNHVQLSLKDSVLDPNYKAPRTFDEFKKGHIITGKIRKVEDFGVFIVIDNSNNVSGLCHKSQMAEGRIPDVKSLYKAGDAVKALITDIQQSTKKVSFSLKASNLIPDESDEESDNESRMQGLDLSEGGVALVEEQAAAEEQDDEEMTDVVDAPTGAALNAGGFDWSANSLDKLDEASDAGSDTEEKPKKKKHRKSEIKIDRTGDLDKNGPQSISDFERLLLGQPDSSDLWIQYMAFQMQLSELGKAREVAERAIKTINIREETEKMNVWTALLNLENVYGSDETIEEVFKRACQYNDDAEMHERLTSIYIKTGKNDKADALLEKVIKKFSRDPKVWQNYAAFLFNTLNAPDRARALLPRAMQALPPHNHVKVTTDFAKLEFTSPSGSPERGRTIFEGLISTFPKKVDIWQNLLNMEIKHGDKDIVRGVYERILKMKGMKPKGAMGWFKSWSEWEEKNGDEKSRLRVKAKAEEWVRKFGELKGARSRDDE